MDVSASVVLGSWESFQYQSFKIENVDLDSKVETLKEEASKKISPNNHPFGKKNNKQHTI